MHQLVNKWNVDNIKMHGTNIKKNWVMLHTERETLFWDPHKTHKMHWVDTVHIGIFTYSMLQSSSWEANWFAASQKIPRISQNPKVHYRTHKRPPPLPILDQPNPVNIPTTHLLEIHPNIIHPSTPRSPQWSPSLRFPHQDPIHPFSPILATCLARLILLDFITKFFNVNLVVHIETTKL